MGAFQSLHDDLFDSSNEDELEAHKLADVSTWILIPKEDEKTTLFDEDCEIIKDPAETGVEVEIRVPHSDYKQRFEKLDLSGKFQIFVYNYDWVLEYRVFDFKSKNGLKNGGEISDSGEKMNFSDKEYLSTLRPFHVEWIGTNKKVENPDECYAKKEELLDYRKRGTLGYAGWDYACVFADQESSGIEINMMRDKGVRLFVENNSKIVLETTDLKSNVHEIKRCSVTHCYVDCRWVFSAPVVKSLVFYDGEKAVHTLKAS